MNNTVIRYSSYLILIKVAFATFYTPLAGAALAGPHNQEPELCQGIVGAAYAANEIAAIVTPPPLDFIPAVAAYATNLDLKLCEPQVQAPPGIYNLRPDPNNICERTLYQPVTSGEYDNVLGIPAQKPDIKGDLGAPKVFHFNSGVSVRLRDPSVPSGELNDTWHPDVLGNITLPAGRNSLHWRADSLVSIMDFVPIIIPKLPAGSKASKSAIKGSASLRKAAVESYKTWAKKHLSKNVKEFVVSEGIAYGLDQAIALNWRHSQLGVFDDVFNSDSQSVWVFDKTIPKINSNTDPGTYPERVAAIIDYDINTDTYYMEAFQPGGVWRGDALELARQLISYSDACQANDKLDLTIDAPLGLWAVGDTVPVTWTVRDPGPVREPVLINGTPQDDGGHNSAHVVQNLVVRDTNPPILVPPPGKVLEVPVGTTQTTVELGNPQVFDLVDLDVNVVPDHADNGLFDLGLTEVTWTATDDSTNQSDAVQLINVKIEGTNSVPVAFDQSISATSFEPIDITLTAEDFDYHPSVDRFDPLTFSIVTPPENGFFVAPLLPFFIEDFRLEAASFSVSDEPEQVMPGEGRGHEYCLMRYADPSIGPSQWQLDYPYFANWVTVDDDGNVYVMDGGDVFCNGGSSAYFDSSERFVVFDADGKRLYTGSAPSEGVTVTDIQLDLNTRRLLVTTYDNHGPSRLHVYDNQLNSLASINVSDSGTGPDGNPIPEIQRPESVTGDANGIIYVLGSNTINAYKLDLVEGRSSYNVEEVYIGSIDISSDLPIGGSDIAADSEGNLYVSSSYRISKFGASHVDDSGAFVAGGFIGWLGKCAGNLTNDIACDTPNQRSFGYACTDSLCETGFQNVNGSDPGQFREAKGIAVDPNGILYVSDFGNARIQRFTPDGFFAGQAKSQGVGYGFILGDFGNPENVTVNSDHFYILQDKLLHVFETTPITPIDDASAKVTYQSDNSFVGTDQFEFQATDGLDSASATVTVNVERNFRPPLIDNPPPAQTVEEDDSLVITLSGGDPDGDLDVLSYDIVTPPEHGNVELVGDQLTYTPDPNYAGEDSFEYRISDGTDYSDPAHVAITITPVEDTPELTIDLPATAGAGFNMDLEVKVFDPDRDGQHVVSIDWGDDNTEQDGRVLYKGEAVDGSIFLDDGTIPDGVVTTGPVFNMGPGGYGTLSATHAFTDTGSFRVSVCVTDDVTLTIDKVKIVAGFAEQICTDAVVDVQPMVGYRMLVETDHSDPVAAGAPVIFKVTVVNRKSDVASSISGVDGHHVVISGEAAPGLTLISAVEFEEPPSVILPVQVATVGTPPVCSIESKLFNCELGTVNYNTRANTLLVTANVDPLAAGNTLLTLSAEVSGDEASPETATGAAQVEVAASDAPPYIAAVDPASGPADKATTVILNGSDFQDGATVSFNGRPGIAVEVLNSQSVRVTAPPQSERSSDVTLTNPDGHSMTLSPGFFYTADSSGGTGTGGTGTGVGTGGTGTGTGSGGSTTTSESGGGGGCTLTHRSTLDPLLPMLALLAVAGLCHRRRLSWRQGSSNSNLE